MPIRTISVSLWGSMHRDRGSCSGRLRRRALLGCGGPTPLSRRNPRHRISPRSATSSQSSSLFLSSVRILCTLCVSVAIPFLSSAQQTQLNIAAASDLKFAMTELASAYEKQAGVKLNLVFGSSGNFLAQIRNGAPFDLFFSADDLSPAKLNQAGIPLYGTFRQYAIGCVVLWAPADAKVNPSELGWRSLLDPSVQKIAIANPDHAPYGRAALEALKNSGYYDQV